MASFQDRAKEEQSPLCLNGVAPAIHADSIISKNTSLASKTVYDNPLHIVQKSIPLARSPNFPPEDDNKDASCSNISESESVQLSHRNGVQK